jgi:hypothetical protein
MKQGTRTKSKRGGSLGGYSFSGYEVKRTTRRVGEKDCNPTFFRKKRFQITTCLSKMYDTFKQSMKLRIYFPFFEISSEVLVFLFSGETMESGRKKKVKRERREKRKEKRGWFFHWSSSVTGERVHKHNSVSLLVLQKSLPRSRGSQSGILPRKMNNKQRTAPSLCSLFFPPQSLLFLLVLKLGELGKDVVHRQRNGVTD